MIIFINGPMNAGKTTVSKILAGKIPNAALVEIDALREFIAWMPIGEAVPINLENAVSVIRNFAKRDIHSIVPYPLSEKNYEYVTKELSEYKTGIKVFTLSPSLDAALTNRGSRELDEGEKERIKYLYGINIHKPSFGEVIDNTHLKPEETAAIILSKINGN